MIHVSYAPWANNSEKIKKNPFLYYLNCTIWKNTYIAYIAFHIHCFSGVYKIIITVLSILSVEVIFSVPIFVTIICGGEMQYHSIFCTSESHDWFHYWHNQSPSPKRWYQPPCGSSGITTFFHISSVPMNHPLFSSQFCNCCLPPEMKHTHSSFRLKLLFCSFQEAENNLLWYYLLQN